MKIFYIWKKDEFYENDILRKESGWDCFCYAECFKDVYHYFKNKKWCENFEIVDSLDAHYSYSGHYRSATLYLITNEKGMIIDYYKMITPFEKHIPFEYRHKKHTRKRVHIKSNYKNAKKQLSGCERKEIRNNFSINVKQRKIYCTDWYDIYDVGYRSCSKSWKDQSKRKYQYKSRNIG